MNEEKNQQKDRECGAAGAFEPEEGDSTTKLEELKKNWKWFLAIVTFKLGMFVMTVIKMQRKKLEGSD